MQTLIHKTSQRKFEYVNEFIPQFTNVIYVRLRNILTDKIEIFYKDTYLNFFEVVKNSA